MSDTLQKQSWIPGNFLDPSGNFALAVYEDLGLKTPEICVMSRPQGLTPEILAKTALICAAPQMLATLQEIVRFYDGEKDFHPQILESLGIDPAEEYICPDWYPKAVAVIQKATAPLTD